LIDSYQKGDKKFYKVRFYQQYTTDRKSDKGYKTLLISCKDDRCVIQKESWQKGKYIPTQYRCYKMVQNYLNGAGSGGLMRELIKTMGRKNPIVLDKSNKKSLLDEKSVFTKFIVKKFKESNLTIDNSLKEKKINKSSDFNKTKSSNKKLNKIGVKGYYYEDKEKIKLLDYGAYYKNSKLYFDISKWRLWQNEDRKGEYFTFRYNILSNLKAGIEIGAYEDRGYFYPYIEYDDLINILYYHSITGKEKKSFCAVDSNLTTKHLTFSKYRGFNDRIAKWWWSVDFAKIENNLEITPQFLYLFYNNRYKKIDNYLFASGWYQTNSKEECYYSPKFTDSTYIEWHPLYNRLEGIFKVGYSFEGDSFLYSYGFDYRDDYFKVGCLRNHSYKDSVRNYWYSECFLDIWYSF